MSELIPDSISEKESLLDPLTGRLPERNSALVIVPNHVVEGVTIDTHFRFALRHTSFLISSPTEENLEQPVSVEILLENSDGSYSTISLPADQQEQLYSYLTDPPEQQPFDCGCFVQHLFHLEITPDTFDFAHFDMSDHTPSSQVPVGSAIVQYDPETKQALHFAHSIGHGLFLFKTGWKHTDRLTVATFESMAEVYGSYSAKILTPRSD